jgi:serine/threonine-protein kinase HipA
MAVRAKNVHYALHTPASPAHALATKNGGPPVWQAMLGLVDQVEPALATVESRLPSQMND